MIDRKTIAMINGEVDGENSTEESETLRQILMKDPEAKRLFEDLKKLDRHFSLMSPIKPPATLKPAILRSVEGRASASTHTRRFHLSDFLFPVRPVPRLGLAFSGGLLAGVVLVILYFTVLSHPAIDDRDVSGTILGSSESFHPVDQADVAAEGVEGNVATEYSGTMSILRVNLTMQPDLQARFVFNPEGARFKGIALGHGFAGTLQQGNGVLEVGHGGGAFRAFFAPDAAAQNVRLQIVSPEGVLFERSFPLGKTQ